ncbi:MAG: ATP-binding protein [Clostridia bacterium]|nr:ATP-binding protein [Clostridia bacterium]
MKNDLNYNSCCNDGKTLVVDAKKESLDTVIDFLDEYLDSKNCDMKKKIQIQLSLEEIFINVANYAYEGETGKAKITLNCENETVSISVYDKGKEYNPLNIPDPDTTLSAEEREIGGLGIFLVRKNMDEVNYKYENSENVFTMKKKL